jgi:hypothetical protein
MYSRKDFILVVGTKIHLKPWRRVGVVIAFARGTEDLGSNPARV